MKPPTTLVHAGRNPAAHHGMVNTPVYETSTVLFPSLKAYEKASSAKTGDPSYGISGSATNRALEAALAEWEGAAFALVTPSGLAAVTLPLYALLGPGDHLLLVDTVYGPTRRFALKELKRLGVETTFYDPSIGKDIALLIRKNTKLIFLESPGSLTFEMQDIPAIVKAAKKAGVRTMMDNSWATPLYFKPIEYGVDISVQALTKYVGGHSDVLMGSIATSDKAAYTRIIDAYRHLGLYVSADQAYLAARGLPTTAVRMERHFASALLVAGWLKKQRAVAEVIYPPLPTSRGHALWKRDFGKGGAGLLTFLLDAAYPEKAIHAFVDGMQHFGIGASWGGYESLILRIDPSSVRSAAPWPHTHTAIRIHIGLEDPADLIHDLEAGFRSLK